MLEDNNISKVRRLSVVKDKDMVVLASVKKQQLRVRTLINFCGKSLTVEPSMFKRLLYVRVLDLSGSRIHTIPDYIESLIHLRLFNLDNTNVAHLPESIGSLKNLQILNLQFCDALHSLPLGITR